MNADVTHVVQFKYIRTLRVVLGFGYNIHLMGDELFTSVCVISVTKSSKQIMTTNDRYLKMAPSKGKTSRSGQVSDLHQKDNQKKRPVDLARCLTCTKKTTNLQLQQEERTTKEDADDIQKGMGSGRGNNNNNN